MAANYDVALTAGLDSSQVEAGQKGMERDMKAFADTAVKEYSKVEKANESLARQIDRRSQQTEANLAREVKARINAQDAEMAAMERREMEVEAIFQRELQAHGNMVEKEKQQELAARAARRETPTSQFVAGPTSGNGGMYRPRGAALAGAVALQGQDVAVSLSGGARVATVIAQQGSQIASLFRPYGAIIGGVLAIGAGIYSWATALDKTKEKADEFEKKTDQIKENHDALSKIIFQSADAWENMMARANGGSMAEGELKRQKELIHALEEVDQIMVDSLHNKNEMSSEDYTMAREQVRYKYAAEEVLATEERIAHFLGSSAEFSHALAKDADARISGEKEIERAEERHLEIHKKKTEELDKQNHAIEEMVQKIRHLSDVTIKGADNFLSNFSPEAKAKAAARAILTQRDEMGARIAKAGDAIMDPVAAHAERALERKQDHADRVAAERDVDRQNQRNGGLPGHHRLSPAEREQAIRARTDAAHAHRHPKTEVRLSKDDIDSLAQKMMDAADKLNAK